MDDLISRQAALDVLADYIHMVDMVYSTGKLSANDCKDAAHSVLECLPAAEPRRGKWIKNDGRLGWHCSVCEKDDLYAFVRDCDTGEDELQDRYCPNCGAKMEESDG